MSIKRFGSRYGRTIKKKIKLIEDRLKSKHQCPHCKKPKVKRVSVGIWNCGHCEKTFTGKAYVPA